MKNGWIAWILALCLAAAGIAPAAAQAPVQPLIERVVVSYADSGTIDEQALAELTALDPVLGEKWTLIMHLWEEPVDVCPRLSGEVMPVLKAEWEARRQNGCLAVRQG